jgi:predicted amidophosphoribosyltransferase
MAEAGDAIVSVLFPSGCPLCERLLTSASRVPICGECLAAFGPLPKLICEICGLPMAFARPDDEQPLLCRACHDKTYAFDRARSYAVYEGAAVRAILMLKFEQIEPLGEWFAERLAGVVRANREKMAADVEVPVPLHRQRERERGYNQRR